MSRHLRAALVAGAAAIAGLVLAAALVSPNHPAPNPTPTGYRPPLVACDYARTSSQCPTLTPLYAPTYTPPRAAPRTTAPRRTTAPVPRPTRTR